MSIFTAEFILQVRFFYISRKLKDHILNLSVILFFQQMSCFIVHWTERGALFYLSFFFLSIID